MTENALLRISMTSDWCDDKILMISANLLWIWLHDDDLAIFDNMLNIFDLYNLLAGSD